MKLTGVEIPFDTLSTLASNTMLVVIPDNDGIKKLVEIDNQSLPDNEVVLRVETGATTGEEKPQSGCYVWINGQWVWKDPCPY